MKRPAALRDRSFFFAATAGIRRAGSSFRQKSAGIRRAGTSFVKKPLESALSAVLC